MERLYISDLDGTLLTPEKTISPRTREAVNRAIAAGEGFSVATARSASTVVEILQGIQLNLPVVLMNGVFLYDIAADRYLDVQTIPLEAAQRMLGSIEGRRRHLSTVLMGRWWWFTTRGSTQAPRKSFSMSGRTSPLRGLSIPKILVQRYISTRWSVL